MYWAWKSYASFFNNQDHVNIICPSMRLNDLSHIAVFFYNKRSRSRFYTLTFRVLSAFCKKLVKN